MALLDAAPQTSSGPTLLGVPMKQVSLFMLTFQNSALILITHYSRIMPTPGDHRYFPSTAVFLNEVLKLAISLTFSIYDVSRTLAPQTPATVVLEQIYNSVFSGDSWKLAIPASLYTLQNTLQYVALGNLDPAHFQVLYQLKIIATAFFSVIILRRTLTSKRWVALILLTIGISVGSLPSSDSKDPTIMIHDFSDHYFPRSMHELGQAAGGIGDVARELTKRTLGGAVSGLVSRSASYQGIEDDEDSRPKMIRSVGVMAVLVAVTVSGLTGVYFEKVLKDSAVPVSIWTRNIQLSFYSLFPALLVGIVYNDGEEILQRGFFDGYNWIVWTVVIFQAVGGILTSLCINYADNIAKNFATSLSFIISFLFSIWFFDFHVSVPFIIGTVLVLTSIFLYSGPDRRRGRPPPITIVNFEKTTIDSTPRYTDDVKSSLDPLASLRALGSTTSRPASPLRHHNRMHSGRKDRGE